MRCFFRMVCVSSDTRCNVQSLPDVTHFFLIVHSVAHGAAWRLHFYIVALFIYPASVTTLAAWLAYLVNAQYFTLKFFLFSILICAYEWNADT